MEVGRIYGMEEGKKYECESCSEISWNDTFTIPIDYQEKWKKKRTKKSEALTSVGILKEMTVKLEKSEKEIANDAINTIESFIAEL